MDAYDPHAIERKWQQVWDEAGAFVTPNPDDPAAADRQVVRPRDAPVPVGRAPHGPRARLHDRRRRRALPPPQRLHGAAPDGLRRVRAAGRERGDPRRRPPARRHRAQHRAHPRPDEAHGLVDRLEPRGLDARAGVLPLDAVAVPEALRGRARVPQGRARQVVPERPDRARERAGERRPLRALRRRGGARNLEQWFFKITAYADELLDDMALLDGRGRIAC